MKLRYMTTAALALSLVTGCIEIKVEKEESEHKAKHSEREDKEDREDEDKPKHERKEKEEGEEKEEREAKKADAKAELMAKAKITEAQARKIAMDRVPNGTIKEGELEKENGHLQWSFDMTTPDTNEITEVNIDAITGKILGVDKEKPEKEGSEKKADKD